MKKAEENKMNAKAEAILMGFTSPVESKEEVIYILDYMAKVLKKDFKGEEVYAKATKYGTGHKVHYISVSRLDDMVLIALPMTTDEDGTKTIDITSANGVFSYVYNADVTDFSELGYTFYEEKAGRIRRLG